MKKLILILLSVFLLSGCTVVRINTDSIDNIVNVILSKDNTLYNNVGKGYKYYRPRGVTYIDTIDYNEKLYSNGNYYYLYIDINSYYYKREFEYKQNKEAYYSRFIDINKKTGYLEVNKQEDGYYLIEFMYNYAKIEALVKEEDINDVILNSTYILSSIKYNSNVIKIMLNEDYFTNKEERYDIFMPKSTQKKDDFIKVK
ncbi:MAG: membrane lipoprotein lipid attachment site-containing protein [Bacilli bacterium]